MNKLILFLSIFTIVSCSPTMLPTESDGFFAYDTFDFREYAAEGILITTTPPEGDFLAKGLISITLYPEIKEIKASEYNEAKNNFGYINQNGKRYTTKEITYMGGNSVQKAYFKRELTSTKMVIDELVNILKEWDADAVYDFKVVSETIDDNKLTYTIDRVSGFAVKRIASRIEIVGDSTIDSN